MAKLPLLVVLAACPMVAGCLVGWAYPTYSYCPGAAVPDAPTDVFAVRVEVVQNYLSFPHSHSERHTFQPLPADVAAVTSRFRPHVAYGGGVFPFVFHTTRYSMTKLYRRGFDTIVVEPGRPVRDEWWPVASLEEEERAILDLLYRSRYRVPDEPCLMDSVEYPVGAPALDSKPMTAGHRQTLLFAAAEFERLAPFHSLGSDSDVLIRGEIEKLRELAAE